MVLNLNSLLEYIQILMIPYKNYEKRVLCLYFENLNKVVPPTYENELYLNMKYY